MRYLISVLALVGLVVSSLALQVHYSTGTEPCSINERWDCGIVNHSTFAEIEHVPVAAIGIAGYADMPRGCIVGTGMLSQIHKTENITGFLEPWELKWGEYESGRYAWELSDLDLFKSPVKCTGRQGLFNVDLESSVVTGSQQHFLF